MLAGLQKMTLLDYPGKVACTVFIQGCNFRCPFCHNSGLLEKAGEQTLDEQTLLAFLNKRVGLLDGVCITGGEPTLWNGLPALLKKIKALGYPVKLDTNGSRPQVLKALVEGGLVDYVAMDLKNSPARYGETVGVPAISLAPIEESIRFLLAGNVPFELRTTVAQELHTPQDMQDMGKWLHALDADHKAERFFIQPYVDRDSVLFAGLHTPSREKLLEMRENIALFVQNAEIRGFQ